MEEFRYVLSEALVREYQDYNFIRYKCHKVYALSSLTKEEIRLDDFGWKLCSGNMLREHDQGWVVMLMKRRSIFVAFLIGEGISCENTCTLSSSSVDSTAAVLARISSLE